MNAPGLDRNLLRDVSRSFYVSLRLLPRQMRAPCALGYLLARLSDTIADTAALPVSTRLQLLRDFRRSLMGDLPFGQLQNILSTSLPPLLQHAGEARLVEATEACFRWMATLPPHLAHTVSEVVQIITTGQESDLQNFPGTPSSSACLHGLASAGPLVTYTDQVAGCVGRFWTQVGFACFPRFSTFTPGELSALGTRFGQALQLVNILRDLPEDLDAGRCYLPLDELGQRGWRSDRPWREQTAPLRQVAASWEATAEAGLRDGLRYANSLRQKRTKLATALPALLGLQTLDLLRREPEQRFARKIKISRQDLRSALIFTIFRVILGQPISDRACPRPT